MPASDVPLSGVPPLLTRLTRRLLRDGNHVPVPTRRGAAALVIGLLLVSLARPLAAQPRPPVPDPGGVTPRIPGAVLPPASTAPAPTPTIPAGPPAAGDILLLFAAPDSVEAFRAAVRTAATGWQIYEDAGALSEKNGGVLFALLPAAGAADAPAAGTTIVDAVTSMLGRRGGHYLQTQPAMDMADGLQTTAAAGGASPASAPVDGTWLFTKPNGLIVTTVKPQKDAAFLLLLGKLRTALQRSPRAVRQEQARTWRVLKVTTASQGGVTTYISILDRTVPDANYAWSSIFADALQGDERLEAYAAYGDTVASMTLFDLTPLPR